MHLGGTVEELQARMSSTEFTMWRAYNQLYPFGYDIENYRMGTVAAAITNMAGKVAPKKPVSPSVFYPSRPKKKKELTERQRKQLEQRRKAKQNGHR